MPQAPTDPAATSDPADDTPAGDLVDRPSFTDCLSVLDPSTPDPGDDPSETMFMGFLQPGELRPDDSAPVVDDTTIYDSSHVDDSSVNVSIDGLNVEDAPPVDGWDPSWEYTPFDGEVTDSVLADDDAVNDGGNVDDTGAVVDDAEVKINLYHRLKPDVTDDDVVVEEFITVAYEPVMDEWDPSWAYSSFAGSPDGALDDAVKIDDIALEDGVPFDEVESDNWNDGIKTDVLAAEDFEPQIRYFSLGGPEVQRTMVSSNEPATALAAVAVTPAAATLPVTLAPLATNAPRTSIAINNVPVQQATSVSLFSSSRDKSAIPVALTSPSNSESIGSSLGTKSSSTPKRSKSQLQSISQNSDETSGLKSLSPLIGDDADSPEVDSAPSQQKMPSDNQVTAEPTAISRSESVESSSSAVVQNSRPSRTIRPGMIDEMMSQYAQNSYNG